MNKFWTILIIGVLIRVFLSFSTFHTDIAALSFGGSFISQGHILNFYDLSSEKGIFNYPPLTYWYFGIISFLFGDILWLFKIPYLIFDLLLAFILIRLVDSKKLLIFTLWMFNPVNLYATYMMGQFDIIPTFFSILSIYFAFRNKLMLASLALGAGIAFKLYPIFLIIPLFFLGKGLVTKIKLIFLALLPYLISILPYLLSPGFKSYALFANQSSKSLYAAIPVSGGESILLFPAFLLLFYLLLRIKVFDKSSLWKFYLIPLLLFFIFTHTHPQWFIWLTPFLILDLVIKRFKNILPISVLMISWLGSLFFFEPSLTLGLFSPILPFLQNTPDIWTLLSINIDYNFSRSVLQTMFTAASLYLIYEVSKKELV